LRRSPHSQGLQVTAVQPPYKHLHLLLQPTKPAPCTAAAKPAAACPCCQAACHASIARAALVPGPAAAAQALHWGPCCNCSNGATQQYTFPLPAACCSSAQVHQLLDLTATTTTAGSCIAVIHTLLLLLLLPPIWHPAACPCRSTTGSPAMRPCRCHRATCLLAPGGSTAARSLAATLTRHQLRRRQLRPVA
jgi:hypothetical protein